MTPDSLTAYVPYVLSAVVAPLVGVLAFKWTSKIQTRAARESAENETRSMAERVNLQAAQTPLTILTAAVTARDTELTRTRESHEKFMHELVSELTGTLGSIKESCISTCQVQKEILTTLIRHTEDSTKGRGILHARINNLQLMVAGIKTLPPEETQS